MSWDEVLKTVVEELLLGLLGKLVEVKIAAEYGLQVLRRRVDLIVRWGRLKGRVRLPAGSWPSFLWERRGRVSLLMRAPSPMMAKIFGI